ncbi:MAG: DJ-1/PfpI family protein [Candidatus Omnitrophota bacterium]
MEKVVMIIADNNFRDEELLDTKAILEKNDIKVIIASTTQDDVYGMLGAKVKPDILLKDIKAQDFDAVIFVGGSGAEQYWNDPVALNLAKEACELKKIVAAICIAPVILANAGILKDKKATVWPSEKEKLKDKDVFYSGKTVEIDENIITADGPQSAREFAEAISKALR